MRTRSELMKGKDAARWKHDVERSSFGMKHTACVAHVPSSVHFRVAVEDFLPFGIAQTFARKPITGFV